MSGDIGRHGIAILAQREGLRFESSIESDATSVYPAIHQLFEKGLAPHCMRDPTRGGVASAVVEVATQAGLSIELDGPAIPVRRDVAAACAVLGLDPLVLACEGCFLAWTPAAQEAATLELLRKRDPHAACIGRVRSRECAVVELRTEIGTLRRVELLAGLPLPRIC